MIDPNAPRLQRKPRRGDLLGWGEFRAMAHPDPELAAIGLYMSIVVEPSAPRFVVVRTPEPGDNLCWIASLDKHGNACGDAQPFIWNFREGRNQLARIFKDGRIATTEGEDHVANAA